MFAVAEFGSVVRKTNDIYSDRDLLIVSERLFHKALRLLYEAAGYTVSILTPNQLSAMQRRGSLFIQHLKLESTILFDEQGRFQSWLNDCEMVVPTDDEMARCSASLEFLYNWPNDPRLTGWKADVAYCVSRDFFIKYLARKSKLAFGIDDIEKALMDLGFLQISDFQLFSRLREFKALYRTGKDLPFDSESLLDTFFENLASRLGLLKKGSEPDTIESYIISLNKRNFNSTYEKLRSLEAAYLIVRSQGKYHPQDQILMKIITAPNAYGSAQIRKKKEIREYLLDVISILADQSGKL